MTNEIISHIADDSQGGFAAAPYLDNIETSCQDEFSPNPNHIKASEPSDDEKLYNALKSLTYYKKLSEDITKTLLLCATPDDYIFGDRMKKMLHCGTSLSLNNSGTIISSNFCRLRICSMCQRRRSLRVASEFFRIMDYLEGYSWIHLVLTVPNCCEYTLPDVLDSMQVCSSRFFRIKEISKAFRGVARCTEISYNNSRSDYHPHFHCLVAVKKSYFTSRDYLKIDFIRRAWTVLFVAHSAGVDVRRKNDAWIYEQMRSFDTDSEILFQCHVGKADKNAVPEIAKYCVKPLEIGLHGHALFDPLKGIFLALHKRRLIQTYGVIRDAVRSLKIDLNSDETDTPDANILDRTNVRSYNWNRSLSAYEQTHIDNWG